MILSEDDIEEYHRMTLEKYVASEGLRRETSIDTRQILDLWDFDTVSLPAIGTLVIEDRWLQTNDVVEKVILFAPHNFPDVRHLDLAESYFFRSKEARDEHLSVRDPLYYKKSIQGEFRKACAINILNAQLNSITCNPFCVTRLMKSFLGYARTSRCIKNTEKIPLTRFCLKALYRQSERFWPDESLVVEVLRTFCVSQIHKEDLVIGDYSYKCLEYIIKSCTAAKFNIRLYFMHDDRGRAIPFCPVTSCILSGQHDNFLKIKVLLEHGFELKAVNTNMRDLVYILVRMNQQLGNSVMKYLLDSTNDLRSHLLVDFVYMERKSSGSQLQWVHCSNTLFNSVSDPFIYDKELHFLLKKIYGSDRIKDIENSCSVFPGYSQYLIPRNLKHLCRCAIRLTLRENFQLPGGIDILPLPKPVMRYLRNLDY